jgi:hypothetical protein
MRMGWGVDRCMWPWGGGCERAGTEDFSGPVEHMPVPRAQEAVIAYVDASVWQHVLQKPTHEQKSATTCRTLKCHNLPNTYWQV